MNEAQEFYLRQQKKTQLGGVREMNEKLTRRAVAGMLLAAPFVIRSAGPVSAQGLKEISYVTPFGHSTVYAPEYVAVTNGFFENHGLKVNLIAGNGSSAAVQQLLGGQVQVSRAGGIDVAAAVSTGDAPIRSFGTVSHTSTWWIMSGADNPIKTPEDFKGKTIGIVSAGGGSEKTINIVLATAGLSPEDLTYQVVGNSPGTMDLVKLGRLDGFIGDNSVYSALKADGAEMHAMSIDPYLDMPGQVYLTSQQIIDTDPDMLLGFMNGIRDAVRFILKDESGDATLEAMMPFDFPELDTPETVKRTLLAEKGLWDARGDDGIGKVYPEAWTTGWAQMVKAGLAADMDPSVAYTTVISDKL
jgi:NitT/TauT family transport system substrate-binding protein